MMMDDDNNIKQLPVKFKRPIPDRTFLRPYEVGKIDKCWHRQFIIDPAKAEVECAECGERLDPMWVLTQLASQDHTFNATSRRYHDEMKRLDDRSRTKCYNCGAMTPISRR